jgi:hypothetical protein
MAPTTEELPRLATEDQVDDLLDHIASVTANIRTLEAELADAKATLTEFFASGMVDESFQHNDWSFVYTKGRTTYTYSDEAKRAIKTLQDSDKALGRATQKQGASFWTVKPPAI